MKIIRKQTGIKKQKPALRGVYPQAKTISVQSTEKDKIDKMGFLYDHITQQVIESLKKGVAPWKRQYSVLEDGSYTGPQNFVTGRPYTSINMILLSCLEYSQPFYLSLKDIDKLGGRIKKGQKGNMVTYWKFDPYIDKDGFEQTKPLFRYYLVWNIEQTEGIDLNLKRLATYHARDEQDKQGQLAVCERVIANFSGPAIFYNSPDRAFYQIAADSIRMPRLSAYRTPENFYKTKFHELVHSTGHSRRLNRDCLINGHTSQELYAKEELIAEMGAAFLVNHCGISYDDRDDLLANTAAYCQAWISVLQNDTKLLVRAASAAKRAVTYILNGVDPYLTQPAETDEFQTA